MMAATRDNGRKIAKLYLIELFFEGLLTKAFYRIVVSLKRRFPKARGSASQFEVRRLSGTKALGTAIRSGRLIREQRVGFELRQKFDSIAADLDSNVGPRQSVGRERRRPIADHF